VNQPVRRIFYYTPDHNVPSWGMGMLYSHVSALRRNGFEAYVLHQRAPFRLSWLKLRAPFAYLDDAALQLRSSDVLVVPEILAADPGVARLACRKTVFVQGSSLIVAGLGGRNTYPELGYEAAIAVMPHIQKIITRHFGLAARVVPPYVAPYFFGQTQSPRRRRIVLYPKMGGEDYLILTKVLQAYLTRPGSGIGRHRWQVLELKGISHREVARVLRSSLFHVNINCQESFNATVPEAMAAGCIPICYEGFGGQDFLRNGKNAFVFPNHYIFPLVDRLFLLMEQFDRKESELDTIRNAARETASRYTEEKMAVKLTAFFRSLLCLTGGRVWSPGSG
jgi:glycosyltransferase involved in cell wall biosynthesis